MQSLSDTLALTLARLGPVGLSPFAPGTAASAVAALAAPWVFLPWPLPGRLALLAALTLLGGWAATRSERLLNEKDPPSVVIDELVGQWIVLLPLASFLDVHAGGPFLGPENGRCSLPLLFAAFCLFRLFDIGKPGPVRASERWLPGGGGVMLDDIIAGFFGLLLLAAALAASAFLFASDPL